MVYSSPHFNRPMVNTAFFLTIYDALSFFHFFFCFGCFIIIIIIGSRGGEILGEGEWDGDWTPRMWNYKTTI